MAEKKDKRDEILFVDDEMFFAERYIEQLEKSGFKVHFRDRAADAIVFLKRQPPIKAMVLDVMMPTPDGIAAAATNGGLETGLWLLGQIQDDVDIWPFPIMILTNSNPQATTDGLAKLKIPGKYVEVRRKIETPAFAAPDLLAKLIQRVREMANALR